MGTRIPWLLQHTCVRRRFTLGFRRVRCLSVRSRHNPNLSLVLFHNNLIFNTCILYLYRYDTPTSKPRAVQHDTSDASGSCALARSSQSFYIHLIITLLSHGLYNIQCTVYRAQCTVYCTVYSVCCTSVYCTVYSVQCTLDHSPSFVLRCCSWGVDPFQVRTPACFLFAARHYCLSGLRAPRAAAASHPPIPVRKNPNFMSCTVVFCTVVFGTVSLLCPSQSHLRPHFFVRPLEFGGLGLLPCVPASLLAGGAYDN
jgi:hypothetical protein